MKRKHKGLNGYTPFFVLGIFLLGQLISGIYWGGMVSAKLDSVAYSVHSLANTVESNRLEAKTDIKSLETQLYAAKAVKRSA